MKKYKSPSFNKRQKNKAKKQSMSIYQSQSLLMVKCLCAS